MGLFNWISTAAKDTKNWVDTAAKNTKNWVDTAAKDVSDFVAGDRTNQVSSWNDKKINNEAKKTYIVIHGYTSNASEDWVKEIESNLAKKDPSANVLALDWLNGGLQTKSYIYAASKTEEAGKQLAHYLKDNGIDPANVEVIGHSLGAHVAAYASEEFYKITQQGYFLGNPVRRGFGYKTQQKCSEQGFGKIVALDPAGVERGTNLDKSPLFHRKSHAGRVVAIHTNYTLGTERNVGDLDLHVNRHDTRQPNTTINPTANHSYSHEWYSQLLKGEKFKQDNGSTIDFDTLSNATGESDVTTTKEARDRDQRRVRELLEKIPGVKNFFSEVVHLKSGNMSTQELLRSSDSVQKHEPFIVQGNENTASQLDNSDSTKNDSYAYKLYTELLEGKNNIESVHTSSSNLDAVSNQNSAVDITTTNNVNHPIPFAEVLQNSDLFVATTMASNSDLTQTPNTTILSGIGGFEPLVPVCELPIQNYDPLVGQAKGINYPIPSTEVFQDSDIFGADSMVDNSDLNQNPSNAFQSINFGEVAANLPLGGDICQHDNLVEPITMGSWSQSSGSSFDLNTLGNVQSFNNIVSTQTGLNFVNAEQHSFA